MKILTIFLSLILFGNVSASEVRANKYIKVCSVHENTLTENFEKTNNERFKKTCQELLFKKLIELKAVQYCDKHFPTPTFQKRECYTVIVNKKYPNGEFDKCKSTSDPYKCLMSLNSTPLETDEETEARIELELTSNKVPSGCEFVSVKEILCSDGRSFILNEGTHQSLRDVIREVQTNDHSGNKSLKSGSSEQ